MCVPPLLLTLACAAIIVVFRSIIRKKTQRLHSELALLSSLQVSAYYQPQPLIIEVVTVFLFFNLDLSLCPVNGQTKVQALKLTLSDHKPR